LPDAGDHRNFDRDSPITSAVGTLVGTSLTFRHRRGCQAKSLPL
jgi:hypothetical protein